jgi:hypothetical protein
MLRRVVIVITDVSEERIASITRVKRISELGATLAVTNSCYNVVPTSPYYKAIGYDSCRVFTPEEYDSTEDG